MTGHLIKEVLRPIHKEGIQGDDLVDLLLYDVLFEFPSSPNYRKTAQLCSQRHVSCRRLKTAAPGGRGAMSSATKRKHVTRDVVESFTLPQGDEIIVQVALERPACLGREEGFAIVGNSGVLFNVSENES
jgi:hypothetical protein